MYLLRPVLKFLVIMLGAYVLLIIQWPGVHDAYRDLFISAVHGIYGHFGENGVVRCEPTTITPTEDVILYIGKVIDKVGNRTIEQPTAINSRNLGYAPVAFFASLILATPIPWTRKWRAAFWGSILVGFFVVFRVGLVIIGYLSSGPVEIRLYDLGAFSTWLLAMSYEFLAISPGGTFIVPALIWAGVTWRAQDIQAMLAKVLPESATPDEPRQG